MDNMKKTNKPTGREVTVVAAKNEILRQLGDKETFTLLLNTTFKGLNPNVVKRAAFEGHLRGFTFKDFLEKNVYAIPFREGYSLVSSIDYARKIGMRSGVVGKSAPIFEMDNKKIVACTITVKRKVNGVVGEWTATVYFDEYTTSKNLWNSKPRTMIAKVAEMHALRMACPEELSQTYSEEELAKEQDIGDFDRSEIEDDAEIISTGDDDGSNSPSPDVQAEIEEATTKEK